MKCKKISNQLIPIPCNHKNCSTCKNALICNSCINGNEFCKECEIFKAACKSCSAFICDCNSKNHLCSKLFQNKTLTNKPIHKLCDNCHQETLSEDLIHQTQCNHKYCRNCNIEECNICAHKFKRTEGFCENCKSSQIIGRRKCNHYYCNNCEHQECVCYKKCVHCNNKH